MERMVEEQEFEAMEQKKRYKELERKVEREGYKGGGKYLSMHNPSRQHQLDLIIG